MPKQTGPRTSEGKTKSSRNAVQHGLSSAIAVLPFESQDEFNILVDTYIREEKPRSENEIHLAREMATARWKLDRLRRIENAVLEFMLLGDAGSDCPYAILAKKMMYREGDPLSNLQRFQSALERTYFRCNKELQTLKKQPLPPAEPKIQNEMPVDQPEQSCDRQEAEIAHPPTRLTAAFAIQEYRKMLALMRDQLEEGEDEEQDEKAA